MNLNPNPTADQITDDASLEVLTRFLKFAHVGQFRRLTIQQVDNLNYVLEEAYTKTEKEPG